MDRISIKANLALLLKDSYTGSEKLKGVVSVRTHNGITALSKGNGWFVFANCKSGFYKIYVESACYRRVEFECRIDETIQIKNLLLLPDKNYSFSESTTKLCGKTNRAVQVAFLESENAPKILGDAAAGGTMLKIYFPEEYEVEGFMFCIKGEERWETYGLTPTHAKNIYETDRPLETPVAFGSSVLKLYRVEPGDRNEYFLAVRNQYEKAVIIEPGRQTEVELHHGENRYDIWEV